MSQYIHDRWGPEQGFPRGAVYAITQTADGYLWIGTEAGLFRFDGLRFHQIRDESRTFNIAGVLGLLPDSEGNLWVRLQGPMMLRYFNRRFDSPLAGLPYANITAMARTNEGALIASAPEQGAVVYRRGKFEMLAAGTTLPRSPVISLTQAPDGDVWMGTRDVGLFRLSGNKVIPITRGLPDPKVNCLLAATRGELLIGTDNGVVSWNGAELKKVELGPSPRRMQVLAMARDRDRNLWLGTGSRGLLRINDHGVSSLGVGDLGSNEAVTAVFEDRDGNMWIGSARGLERLRDSPFITYSLPEGLPSDGSNPVFVDTDNRVWFSPVEGGLLWTRNGRIGRVAAGGLSNDTVYSIAGGEGELWLGRQRGGLTRLREANGTFIATNYTQADGLAQNSVYSVYRSRDGTVWAGTLSGGVSKLSGGRFRTYTTANGLAANTVASMIESSDATMWFATPNGLSTLSQERWQTFLARDGLPSNNVNCLLEDSAGVLWAGTSAGLAFRGPKGFLVPSGVPEALHEQILGIAEDRHGSIWLATSNHVLRVKRDKLMKGSLVDGDVREYGLADGLRGLEGVKRHRSVVSDSLGRIWFSMNRGISTVDPARLLGSSAPAIVNVQAIAADGQPLDISDPVRIPAGRQRITFGFTGLTLSIPERVRFRYRLEGFDRDWSQPTLEREAVYTNLNPDSYRFRVIASNTDGAWNSSEASFAFEVEAEYWQSWWFRLSAVLALTFAIAGVYRFRLHQIRRQLNVRFEERLAERTRIARDLHDTLLQGFLSASMQLHVASERLPEDSPAKPSISRVLQLMGQVIEEGRNTVRGLRASESDAGDLGQAFSRIKQELAVGDQVEFRVIIEGHPIPLHPILRDEVYRIGREALVNAFLHSRAQNIELELEYAAKRFRFLVRDNGCGIEPGVLQSGREGHWGLPGMRERAEKIGAHLQVWSGASAGTEVELSIPSGIAYQIQPSGSKTGWFSRKRDTE